MGFDDVTGYPGAVLSVIGKAVMVPAIQTWGCPSRHERMGVMSLLTLELRYHSAVMQVSVSEMQGIVGTYLSDRGYLSIRQRVPIYQRKTWEVMSPFALELSYQ